MALETIVDLMRAAREGRYAVGYFESWNLDSLQGTVDAAEQTRSPIILGFNGEFLSHAGRTVPERLAVYGAMGKAAAEAASVPCGLIFNECAQDDWVKAAALAGFNLVMPADPQASFDDYKRRVQEITRFVHAHGGAVEAELGELPCGASGTVTEAGAMTDPDIAAAFVEETKVDLLAVSVGNVHIQIHGQQGLNLNRLRTIHERISVPLVLHGGTGITTEALHAAISLGVAKVNYGTYLKQRYLAAVRTALETGETNPHVLLGLGEAGDVMTAGRLAVRDAVLERICHLGCCGKA